MSELFFVNGSLVIDLVPSVDDGAEPMLCLRTRDDPQQSILISLSEVFLVRDVLAQAGGRLAQLEAVTRQQRKTAIVTDSQANLGPAAISS